MVYGYLPADARSPATEHVWSFNTEERSNGGRGGELLRLTFTLAMRQGLRRRRRQLLRCGAAQDLGHQARSYDAPPGRGRSSVDHEQERASTFTDFAANAGACLAIDSLVMDSLPIDLSIAPMSCTGDPVTSTF